MKLYHRIVNKIDTVSVDGGIIFIKDFLAEGVIAIFCAAGFITVVVGGTEVWLQGREQVAFVYICAYLPILACFIFRRKISSNTRINIVLLDLYILAVLVLCGLGLSGAGIVFLITFCVLTTTFKGTAKGLIALLISVLAIMLTGLAMYGGVIPIDTVAMTNSTRIEAWSMAAMVFLLVSMTMVLCISLLQNSLQKTINNIQKQKSALQNANDQLEKAVNNLKLTEKERLKINSLLEAALESTADGILIVDKNGLWSGCNQKFLDLWNIPDDIVHSGEDKKFLEHALDKLKHPEAFILKTQEIYGNENEDSFDIINLQDNRILERYSKPQKIKSQTVGRVWSFRDVTKQKVAENELKESEEYHKGLFENLPTALYIQDFSKVEEHVEMLFRKGVQNLKNYLEENPREIKFLAKSVKIIQANHSAVKLYRADTAGALLSGFSKLIKYDDLQHFIDQVLHFTSGKDWYDGEARNVDYKGRTLDVILRKAVINRKKNGLSRILVSVVDVTDLYQSNKEKRQLEVQLQQAQKMEAIGTLAGGIAHDFNNILFPITGHAELLLADIPESSPLRKSITEIYSGARRATDLVKQILSFSRQESSELQLVKIQHIAQEVLKLMRSTIPTTIEIKKDIDNSCGPVKADPTQIHQVIMNLVTNAYHAMDNAGGVLVVSLREIEFGELDKNNPDIPPGRYVNLIIRDSGTGMTKEITEQIFNPFFTTKENGKGTGMGLAVVHRILGKIGGTIAVNSEPGKGTEFEVYFPTEQKTFKSGKVLTDVSIAGGNECILLVDDEPGIIDFEKQVLERLGYKVSSRVSSVEAFEAFKANSDKYDLVISDVAMPKLSGDKLAEKILNIRRDIPILLCTGFSDTVTEERVLKLGVKGLLMKPLILKDLAEKIRNALDDLPNK